MKYWEITRRSRLHIIVFVFLGICTRCFAQNQEEEAFYRLYPDLRAHREIVQMAYEQLKQSGFQTKTLAQANRSVAIRAYLLLNQSSGAKIPYRQVLEMYNEARSEFPGLKDTDMSLPEFARQMNNGTGSSAFDEGLNDNWVRRVSTNIDITLRQGWNIVILEALAGLILLVIVFRVTSRPQRKSVQQDQSPVVGEPVWQRAMRPAGIAAKWAAICGTLSVFRVEHLSLVERIGFAVFFSVALALLIALPVYLIAVLSYAIGAGRTR